MCCYCGQTRLRWHGGRGGCSRATVGAVWAAAAAPERAAAAPAAGNRGPAAGHGGVRTVAQVVRVSETTIRKGLLELDTGEGHCQGVAPGGRVVDASGLRTTTRSWCLPCWGWSSQTSGGIRCHRCGGRRSRCGTLPSNSPSRAMSSRRPPSAGCYDNTASACRPLPRPWRAHSTRIGMPSSATSTSKSSSIRPTVSRSSAWTPRKRNCSGSCPTPAGSGARKASRSGWRTTASSPVRRVRRPSLTASTTSPPMPAGSTSASTTTPRRSPSPPSAAGGRGGDEPTTRTPPDC